MYITVLGALVVLTGVGIWHVLKKYTRLREPTRVWLTALFTILATFPLLWLTVSVSILLYQLNDPISW